MSYRENIVTIITVCHVSTKCPSAAVAGLYALSRPSGLTAANILRHQRRRGVGTYFMPHLGVKALLLLAFLRHALGWRECEIDPADEWVVSEPDSVTKHMFMEYERRYTCSDLPGESGAQMSDRSGTPDQISMM